MREAIDNADGKVECFSDLTGGASPAIGNDVRRHGRAVSAVATINFLNHAFTPVAAGQIEINVWPTFAAFAEKALENEVIADRINRCNPKAITDRTIGGAAAPLHHDIVFAAEIDDVPDNQKIPRKL